MLKVQQLFSQELFDSYAVVWEVHQRHSCQTAPGRCFQCGGAFWLAQWKSKRALTLNEMNLNGWLIILDTDLCVSLLSVVKGCLVPVDIHSACFNNSQIFSFKAFSFVFITFTSKQVVLFLQHSPERSCSSADEHKQEITRWQKKTFIELMQNELNRFLFFSLNQTKWNSFHIKNTVNTEVWNSLAQLTQFCWVLFFYNT